MNLFQLNLLQSRNPALDLARATAISLVILNHFFSYYAAPFPEIYSQGLIGVDLFFVISGYLVGRQPLAELFKNNNINFKVFYIKRIFKIIPSFYFFVISYYIILNFILPLSERSFDSSEIYLYLLFLQNYSGSTAIYHAWSICVEEHFYILLPLSLLIISCFSKRLNKLIPYLLLATIISAYVFRALAYHYGYDTYAATHNRIDALSLGVLLAFLDLKKSKYIYRGERRSFVSKLFLLTGIALFVACFLLFESTILALKYSSLFDEVLYHGLVPLSFFLILSQCLHISFHLPRVLSFIALISYNLYLWHRIILNYFVEYIEDYRFAFIPFVILSILISYLVTVLLENPFLRLRKLVLAKV